MGSDQDFIHHLTRINKDMIDKISAGDILHFLSEKGLSEEELNAWSKGLIFLRPFEQSRLYYILSTSTKEDIRLWQENLSKKIDLLIAESKGQKKKTLNDEKSLLAALAK